FQRCFDFLLIPLLSAGLSLLIVVGSGSPLGAGGWQTGNVGQVTTIARSESPGELIPISTGQNAHNFPAVHQLPVNTSVGSIDLSNSLANVEITAVPVAPASALINPPHDTYSYSSLLPAAPEGKNLGITVGLRSIALQHFGNGASAQANSPVSNVALSCAYAMDSHQSIGIEFGQEYLGLDVMAPYDILIGDPATGISKKTTIEQSTSRTEIIAWLGAFYRYSFSEFPIADLHPFAEILGGATRQGPIAKGSLGLEYFSDNSMHYAIGFESTYLNYAMQSSRHYSLKYALTAGLSVTW
ncbi:MAG: hypothetical protein Q8919_06780, partial [Bacteroidota bacterium]|nr:hypothetical protein [Bacteroidota bacterium]